jgi:hypothetical protein
LRNLNPCLILLLASVGCSRGRGAPDASPPPAPEKLMRFRVELGKATLPAPFKGRLLVLLDDQIQGDLSRPSELRALPPAMVVSADVELAPGGEVVVDTRRSAPAYAEWPAGRYRIEAVLDAGGDFAVGQAGPGDVLGPPIITEVPGLLGEVKLKLDRVVPPSRPRGLTGVETLSVSSKRLADAGAPVTEIFLAAAVPPGKGAGPWPAVYEILGYGGTRVTAVQAATTARKRMEDGVYPEMVYVFVSAATPLGHSGMLDTTCQGPWGKAFVEEVVPTVETRLPVAREQPKRRALAGDSAGGRAALRLMIDHPQDFAGAWATAPDWPDLRHVLGASMTVGSTDNLFKQGDGSPRLMRRAVAGRPSYTVEATLRREAVLGGGMWSSMEAQFGSCAADGKPKPVVDRNTGALIPEALAEWQEHDLTRRVAARWPTAGGQLYGKLHVVVGARDDYFIDGSVKLFCEELTRLETGVHCETVPDKTHVDLRGLTDDVAGDLSPTMMADIARALAP